MKSPDRLQESAARGDEHSRSSSSNATLGLAVGSVGVVYGDIGTSPLYALREALTHANVPGSQFESNVIGVVSLLIWALIFIVTIKYVLFILRADNRGEGGTLSLMALAQSTFGRGSIAVLLLGMVGAALFSGDAIITPAISVLSAVEGLGVVTPVFAPFVPYIAAAILVALFSVQRHGTAGIARYFGPIMCAWFLTLAALGLSHIGDAPQIWQALNPVHGLSFLLSHGFISFVVLGSVFLVVTGSEAIYADLGHFGRKPIQYAWIFFVLPALMLNYLGQGAMLIGRPEAISNPFFLMAPAPLRLPMVIFATVATIIASQAVITGAFSIARQAIQLGLLPRLDIQHMSASQAGQIYLPTVNRLMLAGVLLLVIIFRSSSSLASAYGIAISASMVVDSCLLFVVVWRLWRWSMVSAGIAVGLFLAVELTFLASNAVKFLEGGYIPALLGLLLAVVMWTWRRGSRLVEQKIARDSVPLREFVRMLERSQPVRVTGTSVFLTSDTDVVPAALAHNLKHNKALHEQVLVVSVRTEPVPRVGRRNRAHIWKISDDFTVVHLHYGFMENPQVTAALAELRKKGLKFDIMTTS
ncbi:MAG: potassium transporter Kup, partial [Hyphomicrobiales bacterium]|nr:potassium transporter Kup [Hyphomicrobiales bacterium]